MLRTHLNQIGENMRKMFPNHINNEDGHSIDHFIRTADLSLKASEFLELSEDIIEDIVLASFLHDIDDEKFFETVNYSNARNLLKIQKISDTRINHIVQMISLVSYSKNGDSEVPQSYMLIPRLCDRVEATGYIGLLRCFEYTISVKRCFHNSKTIVINKIEDFEKISNRYQQYLAGKKSESMIDHFYDKLLHLNFPSDNEIILNSANQGIQILRDFVLRYWQEFEFRNPSKDEVLNIIEEFKNKY